MKPTAVISMNTAFVLRLAQSINQRMAENYFSGAVLVHTASDFYLFIAVLARVSFEDKENIWNH